MVTTEKTQAPGRPWTVIGTYADFDTAERHASQFRSRTDTQVKVKQMETGFTVRTRVLDVKVSRQAIERVIEERPTFEEPVSKKNKLKAKDRRAKQRKSGSEEIDDE